MSRRRKKAVLPGNIEQPTESKLEHVRVIAAQAAFNENDYLFDDSFKPGNSSDFLSVHTFPEMMECLEKNKDVEAEGIFLAANEHGEYIYKKFNSKAQILEASKKNSRVRKMREVDTFATDGYGGSSGSNAGLVGDDFVPLLGGPFNKQPYLYDYLRAHAYCFHEYHHHPFARAIVHITRDFVLGRGYSVDCDDEKALALWRCFEKVNGLEEMMEAIVVEGSIYGENMIWWLPDNEVNIAYNVRPGQEPSKGIIPRIRMIDPSTCWEVVTFPEDIKRVLFYQIVFPTQYQIYTGTSGGKPVPTSKFVMQQLPASDVMHFKYNCVSNEKRGRSDLFPVLGYLKWLRDCVNYKLIALKKQSAWTEDIAVEGSQADVDNLTNALASLGPFEPAGSRFIHTSKIKREYMSNASGGGKGDDSLDWGINMIAAGSQIPVTYFGLSHSAGQTKASALVGTEPVAKKFERRQREVTRIIESLWRKFQDKYGIYGSDCKVTFPEIISQDRSAKLKDIKFVEDCGYISRSSAAPVAAKELGIDDYDYDAEKAMIDSEDDKPILPNIGSPLTAPGQAGASLPQGSAPKQTSAGTQNDQPQTHGVTKDERATAKKDGSK